MYHNDFKNVFWNCKHVFHNICLYWFVVDFFLSSLSYIFHEFLNVSQWYPSSCDNFSLKYNISATFIEN